MPATNLNTVTTRTIHGAYSDLKTHELYEFAQTSSGNTRIHKFDRVWQGCATFKDVDVFECMNMQPHNEVFYSQGAYSNNYAFNNKTVVRASWAKPLKP